MKGWILYRESATNLRPESYEIHRFIDVAKESGIELEVFQPEQFELVVTREDRKSIMIDGEVLSLPKFVLPRLGAGTTYFALAVIRHLERLGVHTINSAHSIEVVRDKLYTQQILAGHNLPVPKTMLAKFPINVDLVEQQLGFPVVIKTLSGSKGNGVFLCETRAKFVDLMEFIGSTASNANLILQEYVATSRGRDLRVFTIGGRVVACMKRRSLDENFKANFSRGGQVEPYPITPEIEWLATETSRILNLDIAGIDLLFDGDHFKICEANSAPGFRGIEQTTTLSIPEEIFKFVRVRLGIHL